MPDLDFLTFICRTNTVCIDVKEVHPAPKVPRKDWVKLLKDDLKLKAEHMVEVQLHSLTNMLLLKLKTEDIYQQVLDVLREGVLWSTVGKKVYGWSIKESLSMVKIINLTCHISLDKVKQKMEEFGVIVSARLGVLDEFPGVLDGTLLLRMKLRVGAVLPAFIEIGAMGESLQVFSDQKDRTCFKCLQTGHIAPFCRKRAKDIDRTKPMPKSWASIAAAEYPPLEQVEGVDPGQDAQGDGGRSVDGPNIQVPGGGGDEGLEDTDNETNVQGEVDGMDVGEQDDPPSQSLLTGMGLDAEVPSDEVPGLSPTGGEEPRLVLQDQLTDSLDLQLSPEPVSLDLVEKHKRDKVATPGFSTGEIPSLGSQVLVATIKNPGSPVQIYPPEKKVRVAHTPKHK